MPRSHDVVIVGGGIAGAALACVLARRAIDVAVLERDLAPIDRVRGEYAPPWGVIELERLGLLDQLLAAGAIFSKKNIPYDEDSPGDAAHGLARDMSAVLPGAPGSLCMGHPALCTALAGTAAQAGATFLRGVDTIEFTPGAPPQIAFTHNEQQHRWSPRLVIGADGRNSQIRRMAGISLEADTPHHLMGGMLVGGLADWPQDTQVIGNEGRTHYLIFPQGNGRARLYLCYSSDDKALYQGPTRQQKVLQAFGSLQCLPYAAAISRSTPNGPFNSFSNEDHWTDDPRAEGVVLVGDAAGYNDPISGQGLSLAFRDVRRVSDVILAGRRNPADFQEYVSERSERMRRLRVTARLTSVLRVEFGEEARRRRLRAMHRATVEKLPSPGLATLVGPERLPAEAFEQSAINALLAP
jgi:2-polyprenyl-6-methoxyphenol hydroxylase-like FAD-dependent oxidoreductase